MSALVLGVFLASLLGSLHCAGMCGAFLAIAVTGNGDGARHVPLQAAYHGGRLVTYVALGTAAGAAGGLVDLTSTLAGVRPVASALAGVTLIGFGLLTLLRLHGLAPARFPAPAFLHHLLAAGHRRAMNRPPVARAAVIGLLTTLLPCGWLYAFAVTAAGTANPARGALTMAVFWVGTLPVMVAVGASVRRVAGPIGRRLPVLTCVALMVMGTLTLATRAGLDPARWMGRATAPDLAHPAAQAQPACCVDTHGH